MKAVYSYKDPIMGSINIVIPKVREICKGLGCVVITFDNGDKRNIECEEIEKLIIELCESIEKYYNL